MGAIAAAKRRAKNKREKIKGNAAPAPDMDDCIDLGSLALRSSFHHTCMYRAHLSIVLFRFNVAFCPQPCSWFKFRCQEAVHCNYVDSVGR
jgi:hypothetical protein